MIKLEKSYYLIKALLNKTATNSAYQGKWFMEVSESICSNLISSISHKKGLSRNVTLLNFVLCL
jgi:hypothetical protein